LHCLLWFFHYQGGGGKEEMKHCFAFFCSLNDGVVSVVALAGGHGCFHCDSWILLHWVICSFEYQGAGERI